MDTDNRIAYYIIHVEYPHLGAQDYTLKYRDVESRDATLGQMLAQDNRQWGEAGYRRISIGEMSAVN